MSTHQERTECTGRDWRHPLAALIEWLNHLFDWWNRPPIRLDAMDRAAHGGRCGL